jgi:predicted NAD/FAD-dependent oxidoreductase
MFMSKHKPKIAIIGAGIAGLNLANLLAEVAEIVVFEKSDKLGGRAATHHANGFSFDHGAQFFTAKSKVFQSFAKDLEAKQVLAQWEARFVEREGGEIHSQREWDDEFPHYVGTPSMNAIGQHLAKDVDVRFNQLIVSIRKPNSHWIIETAQAKYEDFDWVLVTIPAAQAQAILPESLALKAQFDDVVMQPCFALMLGHETPKVLDWDAAFVSKSILSWISVNSSKPNRGKPFTIVAMSRNDWASKNFDQQESDIVAEMLLALEAIVGQKLEDASYIKLKRWKYANSPRKDEPLEMIDYASQVACCGDWCISGKIESAFTASWQLAKQLKEVMS